jgi:hypothetical protein
LASTVAALRNCFGNFADSLRVFRPEALYRQRGVVRGQPGAPHTRVARPGPGPRHLCVRAASVTTSNLITNLKCPLCNPSQSQNQCCNLHNVVDTTVP